MNWKVISNSYDNAVVELLAKMLQNGDPVLENLRCIYTKKDSDIIYISTAFDFIDADFSFDIIKSFSLRQMINT